MTLVLCNCLAVLAVVNFLQPCENVSVKKRFTIFQSGGLSMNAEEDSLDPGLSAVHCLCKRIHTTGK